MAVSTRAEKRKQIIEHLRDPLNIQNTDAATARLFDVTPAWIAKLREEVDSEGTAFRKGTRHELPVSGLRLDGGTQPRAKLDRVVSREYRDDVKAGAVFPPIGVVYDGTDYWVWDGFHRVDAFMMAGREAIQAEVRQGTRRDAVLLAAGANGGHGLRRTNEDKRRAVEHLLRDSEWACWSNEEIARKCCVTPAGVGKIRKELEDAGEIDSKQFRVGADGRTVNTSSIGPRPSTNGHAAPPDGEDDTDDDSPDDSPDVAPGPAQAPPMTPPVVVDHRVSVTLNGDPDADYARLLESYPAGSLARLGQLIAGTAELLPDDGDTPVPAILTEGQALVLRRLRRGPATSEQLTQVIQSGVRRKWDLEQLGYEIGYRGGKYWLDSEPTHANETE